MSSEKQVTVEQAAFIEKKTKELFDYTIECMDRARTEGNTIIQWYFGIVAGGIGLLGPVYISGHLPIAIGLAAGVGWASYAVTELITSLRSRYTMPPGNMAESLDSMLDETIARMRWREARGVDGRIVANIKVVGELAAAVDLARKRFAKLPLYFFGGTGVAYFVKFFFLFNG